MAETDAPVKAPPRCPHCRSASLTTTQKRVVSSYWRCEDCGYVWHPDRVNPHAGDRFGDRFGSR